MMPMVSAALTWQRTSQFRVQVKAIEELAHQCTKLLQGLPAEAEVYPKQIAFNVLPQIDKFMDNGYTKEE